MANSTGIGFPTTNIQKGHTFHDLDENATYVYINGDPRLQSSWRLVNGIFSNDPDTTLWGNNQSGAMWFNLSQGRLKSWNGSRVTDAVPKSNLYDYRRMFRVQEDFAGGTSGLYWVRNLGAQAGAIVAGFPGVTRLSTSAVSGTLCSYFMGSGVEIIVPTYNVDMFYIVRLNTNDANTTIRIGAQVSGGTVSPPSNGWYFEKLDADVNWFMVTRGGGVETRVDTGIAIDQNFHTFQIVYTGATEEKKFYLDGRLLLTATTNSLTSNIRPALSIVNSAAADKSFDFDYAEVEISGLAR